MAFSGSLTATYLSASGNITKGADTDNQVTLAHGLGAEPDAVILTAKSGTEAGWRVKSKDATNIVIEASTTAGTANSTVSVVALILHSIVK